MERAQIQTLVEELFSALGVAIDELTISEGSRTVVAVSSPDKQALIGPNGEHLRALNHLARRIAETKNNGEGVSFTIDVGNHLENQLETIRANARMLAQRARLFKHEVELPPMSSYERLVIHELFSDDPDIETHSAGEGKFRHVVLKYVEKATS